MMYLIFVFINIPLIIYGYKRYNNVFNPIGLYSYVWIGTMTLYVSGLYAYNELNDTTWLVIIAFEIFYVIGCSTKTISLKRSSATSLIISNSTNDYSHGIEKRKIERAIIILCLLASIDIIPSFIECTIFYGGNLLAKTNTLYSQHYLNGISFGKIPYIGCCASMAVILGGMYITRFKCNWLIYLMPLALSLADSLTGGGVNGLFNTFLLVILSLIVSTYVVSVEKKENKKQPHIMNRLIFIVVAVTIFAVLFIKTKHRANYITVNANMNSLLANLVERYPIIYKIFSYFSVSIGGLNEYLKAPFYDYIGAETFMPFFNIIRRFGIELPSLKSATIQFYTPQRTNTGTIIYNLCLEGTVIWAFLAAFILGFLINKTYKKCRVKPGGVDEMLAVIFMNIVVMSFFFLKLMQGDTWILIGLSFIISYVFKRSVRHLE